MVDDGLERFEAMLGAISKITNGDDGPNDQLIGARCPKCNASDFIKISDLYDEAAGRVDEQGAGSTARAGGMTDRQLIEKFSPPRRASAAGGAIGFAVLLSVAAFFAYRRFGAAAGQLGGVIAVVATVVIFLTRTRRLGDEYYYRRQRWNKLFMCRRCGQLVAP